MADPLLNTLCSICHISTPKYTCPGCNSHTCSLACNKKHKSWANCSGKRDPTAYMPASKLKTPAGVDHDYNFLSSIERERERNQREIVDERQLFSEKELGQLDDPYSFRKQWFGENVRFHPVGAAPRQFGSDGEDSDGADGGGSSNRKHIPAKASQLTRTLRQRLALENVEVVQMPVGMTRQRENTTSWNRKSRRINWCVEWIVYGGGGESGEELKKHTRIRHKALETTPLYKALGNSMAWYKKGHQADEDASDDEEIEMARAGRHKKVLIREVKEDRRRGGGAMQDCHSAAWPTRAQYPTQNPFTGAWASDAAATATSWQADEEVDARRRHRFYLLRPLTVAGKPRELIPVEATDGMGAALRGRTVLEFPTIYVLPPESDPSSTTAQAPESSSSPPLPEGHILGSTERRANSKRQSAAAKRKAGPKDDNARQQSHKRQAVGEAGIPVRPSAAGGGGAQRGRGGAAAAAARGRGKGRGGRVHSARQQRGGDQDAEEGEVNSDGDEVLAHPRAPTKSAAAVRADTSSSDPDSSSDEDEDVDARDGFWASSRPPQRGAIADDEDDGDDGPPEEEATSAPAPTNGSIKKPGTGLVDYGSDSEDGSEDDDDGDVGLAGLQPENPELVAGAIQEIVGMLS
ncbi:hypothetical protein INS49_013629 [Diaporthe citri]|uniref:uncharacterized protein n=1 Tax=Diaporthe citri TaxID=83186 RepID=UPI001C81C6FD|nr:uncharacterized protein INS49_013629 [Diaporthe citri]KAG6357750.1 hypothetical protein INS49_013629 [Diaporthe citri]